MDRTMVSVLGKISAITAIASSVAAAANPPWPKALHDMATTNCITKLIADIPASSKERKIAESMCECMTDGYEKILTVEELEAASKLSTEEQDKLPKSDEMREVIDACRKKYGL